MEGEYKTESGTVIDAMFGYQSVDARIVLSNNVIGTTNTLLEVIKNKAIQIYRK